mgnify:FL=1|tara:strand:- start:2136 stop:2648 length:513 start_codon:yes stop_codon:yes gene_type:complete
MSNLRLINETTASSSASVSVEDVFTTDFNVYKIVTNQRGISSDTSIEGRFIDSSGTIVSSSNYDYARIMIKAWTGFGEDRNTGQTRFRSFGEASAEGASSVSYVFNPMNETDYTYFVNSNSAVQSGDNNFNMQGIAVLKLQGAMSGINFFPDNGNAFTSFSCRVYGLRVD